ncbi:MAG: hypothetical protein KKI15_07660 [Proteobacteria bacterium]|nr:hypothetical protein [Pseudomonadota bacterium]
MTHTRIPLILNDKIRLKNLTAKLRDLLLESGFEVVPDGYGYPAVKFEKTETHALENKSLVSALVFLAKQGVAFETDYKQTFPPSQTINMIREKGLYKGKFIACSYTGSEWKYEKI